MFKVLKELPRSFKPFTTVITQEKKTLTFSEFKVCLRSYEETDESNNILQMKTTLKKINPRNKLGVSIQSRYDDDHHHHVVPLARISLTLFRHFYLLFIASGRSSGLYPVSSHSCCMYVRAGRPALSRSYGGGP